MSEDIALWEFLLGGTSGIGVAGAAAWYVLKKIKEICQQLELLQSDMNKLKESFDGSAKRQERTEDFMQDHVRKSIKERADIRHEAMSRKEVNQRIQRLEDKIDNISSQLNSMMR